MESCGYMDNAAALPTYPQDGGDEFATRVKNGKKKMLLIWCWKVLKKTKIRWDNRVQILP